MLRLLQPVGPHRPNNIVSLQKRVFPVCGWVQHIYLCDDGGQAGLVEPLMVRVGLLIPLPVLQLHLQSFVHPL